MAFHKAIIGLGGVGLMTAMTDTLFMHMRAVRAVTMGWDDRARRGMADHLAIIAALEARDGDRAERLVREHTLGLARAYRGAWGTSRRPGKGDESWMRLRPPRT